MTIPRTSWSMSREVRLAVILVPGDVASEERSIPAFWPNVTGPILFAHSPFADHLRASGRRPFDVVPRTGLVSSPVDQLLGHAPAHQDGDVVPQVYLRIRVPLVDRQLLRNAERHPARMMLTFVDRVRARSERGDDRVPRLVVRSGCFFLVADDHGAPLAPHHHLVLRHLEAIHRDRGEVDPRRVDRRLVGKVREGRRR